MSDVDLMRSLNHVHPAYSLTHDALIFMLAFCREFCTALIEHVATYVCCSSVKLGPCLSGKGGSVR